MGRKEQRKKRKIKNIFSFILFLVFITAIIISGEHIITWIKENHKNTTILNDIKDMALINNTEDIEEYKIDFNSLKKTNPETIAWIKVNGTDIEYPVVKTSNNDFYMTHSFDKSYNSAGWVFMDYRNKFDGTDKNRIIYAHNRRDSSMFGTLKKILKKEWYNDENNYIIMLLSEDKKEEYQVFSVYKIEKEDYYITTNFINDEEYLSFLKTLKSRSIKDFGVPVSNEDEILTLSTCADNNKYRVVLHAKKIKG